MAQVPATSATSTAPGGVSEFSIPFPFLTREEVFVTVDGVSAAFTWINDGLISLAVEPTAGQIVVRFRDTQANAVKHSFGQGGVAFLPRFVDENNKQLLFAVQETVNETSVVAAEALENSEQALEAATEALELVEGAIIDSSFQLRLDLLDDADPLKNLHLLKYEGQFLDDIIDSLQAAVIPDIATLRLTPGTMHGQRAFVVGYHSTTPGKGGGDFYWDSAMVLADDSGTIFGAFPTGRWVRIHNYLTPSMFGAVPDAATDRTVEHQALWTYLAAQLLPSGVQYDSGVYRYTVAPNMAIPDVQVRTLGEVRMRYFGTGNAMILDAGSGSQTVFNVQLGDFIVECPGTALNGVYIRSIHESRLGFNVPTAGAASAGILVEFAVLTTFVRPTVSSNVVSFWGTAPPAIGVHLTRRGVGEQTSYCRFEGLSCAGSPIGLRLDWTLGNIFIGGALQGCTNRGMETTANALRDKFYGLDFEANGTRDIVCLGRQIEFHNCDTTLSVFLAGSFNVLHGGAHETVEVDASAVETRLTGFLYRRNNTGSLINNSLSTCMRDLVRVDVGGSTFRRHNAVPNRATPAAGAGPVTIITNTTGNDMSVLVTGGTVSQIIIRRDGVATLIANDTARPVMAYLSSEDALEVTWTVAPGFVTLSR